MKHEYTDAELQAAALSQLRPIAEAGEVPEGCVRYYTYKKNGEWTTKSKYRAMQDTHYIDTRLPEPEPLVTKPISLPLAESMSLRDWFAGQALNAIASTLNDGIRPDELHFLTLDAYGVADAMLAAREVKP